MNARTPALAALLGAVAADLAIDRGRAASSAAPAPIDPRATWTPELVLEVMVDAQRWAKRTGRPVGPAGYARSRSDYRATEKDHDVEGWGLPEVADPDDLPPMRVQPTAALVTLYEAALEWPADFLCPDHVGSARCLGLFAACKAYGLPVAPELKARRVARHVAYRLRDRGLSLISQGLERDGVPVPQPERL